MTCVRIMCNAHNLVKIIEYNHLSVVLKVMSIAHDKYDLLIIVCNLQPIIEIKFYNDPT